MSALYAIQDQHNEKKVKFLKFASRSHHNWGLRWKHKKTPNGGSVPEDGGGKERNEMKNMKKIAVIGLVVALTVGVGAAVYESRTERSLRMSQMLRLQEWLRMPRHAQRTAPVPARSSGMAPADS
jgi:hypothetical protein